MQVLEATEEALTSPLASEQRDRVTAMDTNSISDVDTAEPKDGHYMHLISKPGYNIGTKVINT